jgi:hypothetical protein
MKGYRFGWAGLLSVLAVSSVFICRAEDDPFSWLSPRPAVVNPAFRSDLRPWVSLDGEWEFALDPNDVGENLQWFASGKSFDVKIHVPGAWEAEGVGEPGLSHPTTPERFRIPLRHEYVGSAWYRKTFRMPGGWNGKRIWIKIGGVNSQGWFWMNGKPIGHLNTYCGTYKFDVTDLIQTGENNFVARISNKVASRKGLLNWRDQFGGFYRSVELEATPPIFIDNLWAQSDFDNKRAIFVVRLSNVGQQLASGEFRVHVAVISLSDGAAAGSADLAIARISSTDTELSIPVTLDPFRAWSPEQPNLYRAHAVLELNGQAIDGWDERFGVRKLERKGPHFYLNGHRFFLRGFGDDYVYPLTISSPTSREEHKKHLLIAKSYGFNYIRNHTHAENPEYYEAADEVGFLIQPELPYYGFQPSSYAIYMPLDDLNELIHHYRRYTSLATYCMGNEGLHTEDVRETLYRMAKLLDPARLVRHQDGIDTDYEGISDFRGGPIDVPIKESDLAGNMPVVLHEYLNLSGPPDPRLEPLFVGAEAPPYHLDEDKQRAAKVGIDWRLAEGCVEGGHELQSIFQKLGLENARAYSKLDGYDYWTIVDINPLRPQGLLDLFWRPKHSSADYFRQFNTQTVLLLPELSPYGDDRNLVSGSKVSYSIACSNYSENAIPKTNLAWSVNGGGQTLAGGVLNDTQINQGTVERLGHIEFTTPTVRHPMELRLQAEIRALHIRNEWKFYCFPSAGNRVRLLHAWAPAPVFDRLRASYPTLKPLYKSSLMDRGAFGQLLITDRLNDVTFQLLQAGGRVLLLSLTDFSPEHPGIRFGWWEANNQRGTAIASSPAFGDFPNESGMPSFAIFRIFHDAVLLAGGLENHVDPLVVTMGKDGYLLSVFQSRVGPGRLFASGLDLLSFEPEGTYLLDEFLNYMQSDQFRPEKGLSVDELRAIVAPSENQKTR